jgi:predicted amidohydrolase
LTARAAENTVHVIGVNSVGNKYPDGRLTEGGSLHVLPDGSEGVSLGPLEATAPAYLDRDSIRRVRERRAFHEDLMSRYSGIYGEL